MSLISLKSSIICNIRGGLLVESVLDDVDGVGSEHGVETSKELDSVVTSKDGMGLGTSKKLGHVGGGNWTDKSSASS